MPTGNNQKAMKIGRPAGGTRKEKKKWGRIKHQPLPQSDDNEEGSGDLEAPAGLSRALADAIAPCLDADSGSYWSPARVLAVVLLVALLLVAIWPALPVPGGFSEKALPFLGDEVVVKGFGTGMFVSLVSTGAHAGRAQVKLPTGRLMFVPLNLLQKAPEASAPVADETPAPAPAPAPVRTKGAKSASASTSTKVPTPKTPASAPETPARAPAPAPIWAKSTASSGEEDEDEELEDDPGDEDDQGPAKDDQHVTSTARAAAGQAAAGQKTSAPRTTGAARTTGAPTTGGGQ